MKPTKNLSSKTFWQEDSFNIIQPEEYEANGIDSTEVPPGTFPAYKHPSMVPSRFGGNAYGFGLFEAHGRLGPDDLQLLQDVSLESPEQIKGHYRDINRIYRKIGLLIRFSSHGRPFYLIPNHLLSSSLAYIQNKAEEISKIIRFHRGKYLKESYRIGILTHMDDLIINELSIRFKEHQFIVIDSMDQLRNFGETVDIVIVARDFYELIIADKALQNTKDLFGKKELEKYSIYILGQIYNILKPDGELLVIADHKASKTSQNIIVTFKSKHEEKRFILFSHIFKTRKKYQGKKKKQIINLFDFLKFQSSPYVENELIEELLGQRILKTMTIDEINQLPYLNYLLEDDFTYSQEEVWPRLLSFYFNKIFFRPQVPDFIIKSLKKKYTLDGYTPLHSLIYMGQKKSPQASLDTLKKDVQESKLMGCPLSLLAGYRDSFDFVTRTLEILKRIKEGSDWSLPDIFMIMLREPLANKKRRYSSLNHVLKLLTKIKKLDRIKTYLNPGHIEGAKTRIINNLELISLLGFSYGELKEIFLIIVGHTTMGRILSGKMNERTLKPVSDLARTYDPQQAFNLLLYCRLMSIAETIASKKSDLNQEQLAELFDLHESITKVVTNREIDWDHLLDEKISDKGGISTEVVRKILKMMNQFQFLDKWNELSSKGEMEKESLADYDETQVQRIENILGLLNVIETFEKQYLGENPLQLSIIYRKFLDLEFHGTGQIFERIDSKLVFVLLWITLNVFKGKIINFNPILAGAEQSEIDSYVNKVEEEARLINRKDLSLDRLGHFSKQLYETGSAFIAGTGFQLRLDLQTEVLDVVYIDLDENISKLESFLKTFSGTNISQIPLDDLEASGLLFTNLEDFYQSHSSLIKGSDTDMGLPVRQKKWFQKADDLRAGFKENFIKVIFQPESIYTDLKLLLDYSPSLLEFILPEFTALKDQELKGKVYLKASLLEHILKSTRKIEALVCGDKEGFQDLQLMHRLAQREFGPMTTGTVGLSDSQIEELISIVKGLGNNESLFSALIQSFVFRDIGLLTGLRDKYRGKFNRADHAKAGAFFTEMEGIPGRFSFDKKAHEYIVLLIRYHDYLHHMVRGEFSLYALMEIISYKDKALFDASFAGSLIMFISMREDLILEDLAAKLFKIRALCHLIIGKEITLKEHLTKIILRRGRYYYAVEAFEKQGIPENISPVEFLNTYEPNEISKQGIIRTGRMIYAMERIFRLRGIRYVEFRDLASHMMNVPLKYVYQRRNFYGIGYATFEKEIFEVLRIYKRLKKLPEGARHFLLEHLLMDEVRIFGFENVSRYLNYENQITLLFIAVSGVRLVEGNGPVYLNLLDLSEKIERRYEAVNDFLSALTAEKIWEDSSVIVRLAKAKSGVTIQKEETENVITIDFTDQINIGQKILYLNTVGDVEQLKSYFYYSLRSLRKSPFFTEDYELELEEAFDRRLTEITDMMLDQTEKQMELVYDFREIHNIVKDLMDRSLEIGFTDDQARRLSDIHTFRQDNLKRDKLQENEQRLLAIGDVQELKDYWDSIKWYLLENREYLGKEFERLIARRFDEKMKSFQE